MNYKTSTIVLLVLLALVIGSVGVYYFLNRNQQVTSVSPTPTIKEQMPSPSATPKKIESSEDILRELDSELNPDNDSKYAGTVEVREGNYAQGTASFGGGGYGWYAVKQDGKWKVILKTQNTPPCSTMEQYGFPQSVYKECR